VRAPQAQQLFNRVSDLLLRLHHDFDYVDESQLERAEVVDGKVAFAESAEQYPLLILPNCRVMGLATARLLLRLFEGGGKILALGELPAVCDERGGDEELAQIVETVFGPPTTHGERRHESDASGVAVFRDNVGDDLQLWLLQTIPQLVSPDVILDDEERRPVEDILCCHRVHEPQGGRQHTFLLVNRSADALRGTLRVSVEGLVQEWKLETGRVANVFHTRQEEGRLCLPVDLAPAEARLFVVTEGAALPEGLVPPPETEVVDKIKLAPHWDFQLVGDNVHILDRWTFCARDKQAGARHRVGCPGQANTYRTTFEVEAKPRRLKLVLDDVRQDIPSHVGFLSRRRNLEIYVNGQQAGPLRPSTWQDPYFWEVDITDLVAEGTNTLEIHTISLLEPFQHLNEPAYLVGDFSVLENRLVEPLRQVHGPFNEQGYPHFAGIARHRQVVEIPPEYAADHRLYLDPGEVHDCCRVLVNGHEVDIRLWAPFEVEITDFVKPGANEIVVEVANSLANLYEKESRTSGLIGPARIWVLKATK
jgi:hypothetical protein